MKLVYSNLLQLEFVRLTFGQTKSRGGKKLHERDHETAIDGIRPHIQNQLEYKKKKRKNKNN